MNDFTDEYVHVQLQHLKGKIKLANRFYSFTADGTLSTKTGHITHKGFQRRKKG